MGWWLSLLGTVSEFFYALLAFTKVSKRLLMWLALFSAGLTACGFLLSPSDNLFTPLVQLTANIIVGGDNVGVKIIKSHAPYSDTQLVTVTPPGLGGNAVLNLDNTAIMRLDTTESSETSVTLLLDVVSKDIGASTTPFIEVRDAVEFYPDSGKVFHFDMMQNKRHLVKTGGRTFVVTLFNIKKISTPQVKDALGFEFGIAEN